jgi:O-acetyl-ADP-ribose deacetylase (regulator of RNase III)
VGPVWQGGNRGEAQQLASCYRRSLEVAAALGASSVAFPSISTGVYNYPKREAARIAVDAVRSALGDFPQLREVIFCCFAEEDLEIYQTLLGQALPRQALLGPHA